MPCTRHCFKYVAYAISFNCHSGPKNTYYFSHWFRDEETEKLNTWVTWLAVVEPGTGEWRWFTSKNIFVKSEIKGPKIYCNWAKWYFVWCVKVCSIDILRMLRLLPDVFVDAWESNKLYYTFTFILHGDLEIIWRLHRRHG